MRILTWHVHGHYLYYLAQSRHTFYVPLKLGRPHGYGGRAGSFPWPDNVREIPAEMVRQADFDCVLFQSRKNYFEDRDEILSQSQKRLPSIYLEHDPPREHPTDTRHPMRDRNVLLVHVTAFNGLMWDSGNVATRVIEHGVAVPAGARYTGQIARGLVVVNNLRTRGRRVGADIFERIAADVPLDLVGMESEAAGGLGEIQPPELPAFESHYRFFFNPIRYTSLGLAVCEAMMIGLPVVGLATTEMATVIQNGVSGYVDTDINRLVERMRQLLADPDEARRLGQGARRQARERFSIERFSRDWDEAFRAVGCRLSAVSYSSISNASKQEPARELDPQGRQKPAAPTADSRQPTARGVQA
jgi:hypothetical protein